MINFKKRDGAPSGANGKDVTIRFNDMETFDIKNIWNARYQTSDNESLSNFIADDGTRTIMLSVIYDDFGFQVSRQGFGTEMLLSVTETATGSCIIETCM